jgi:hypothetical protein
LLDNSAEEMVEQNEVFFCRKMWLLKWKQIR